MSLLTFSTAILSPQQLIPVLDMTSTPGFGHEQQKDIVLKQIHDYIQKGSLPSDEKIAKKMLYILPGWMIFYISLTLCSREGRE